MHPLLWLPSPDFVKSYEYSEVPFRHWIFHLMLAATDARRAAEEFPPPSDTRWHTFTGPLEHGKQEGSAAIAGPIVAAIHEELGSDRFVAWLRTITGIGELQADPLRTGGGIHQSGPDARLGLHVDFNVHPQRPDLVRAVNVILFLTSMWPEHGELVLTCDGVFRGIVPAAGTLVVFDANDENYHGHPVPMPESAGLRKSVPAYYYRPIRDGEQIEPHSTRFLDA